MPAPDRKVVLLEGVSDVAALTAVAATRGVDLSDVHVVDLGGVTNVRRELIELHRGAVDLEILGLCDAPEVRFVEQALNEVGYTVRDASDLSAYGFFICRADLEEELIRALGTEHTVAVIEQLGLDMKLATLRQQPAWQDRPLAEQLHRFCGVASGRKELLAGALAAALDPDHIPEPLQALIDRIAAA
ncbi:MAG TPA: hypothetical protein VG502_09225 [Flexivirga sp.]|uniref:hypothetical protein n=1 Tax=Flexivirga sp. TaxID=1962927 RepID=UPI002B7F4F0F|nr:hypothetical protein [Flexivirga sp.]HWC22466.1 hypothetical protein [Flexivirga sp.]